MASEREALKRSTSTISGENNSYQTFSVNDQFSSFLQIRNILDDPVQLKQTAMPKYEHFLHIRNFCNLNFSDSVLCFCNI